MRMARSSSNIEMKNTTFAFTLALSFASMLACGGQDAVSTGNSADRAIELAQPQPEKPICSRCNMVIGDFATNDDDQLAMVIDSSYEGRLLSVVLTTYDANSVATAINLSSSVVYDLNDPATNVTVVMVDTPDAVAASLAFTYTGGSQVNVISVF